MNGSYIPGPCSVEVDHRSELFGFTYKVTTPFSNGAPGGATLAWVSYKPHAYLFAGASELMRAAQTLLSILDGSGEDAGDAMDELRAAVAKSTAPVSE